MFLQNIFKKKPLQPLELNVYVQQLHLLCPFTPLKPTKKDGRNFKKAIKLLKYITGRIDPENIYINNVSILLWSSIACTYHFYKQIAIVSTACEWHKRKMYTKSLQIYEKIVEIFMIDRSQYVINAIITYITECNLWSSENFCQKLLENLRSNEKCIAYLLNIIEFKITENIDWAQLVLRTLYGLLEDGQNFEISTELLTTFLDIFKKCIIAQGEPYFSLRKGLEVCLKRVIENITNVDLLMTIQIMITWIFDDQLSDECLLDFGNVLEYAAMLHKTSFYKDSLTKDLFPLILKLISSENRLHSLLGNRIFQHILDRHENRYYFKTPQLFTEDTTIALKLAECNSHDRSFIKNFRELIHDTLMQSVIQHGTHRMNMESTYTTIALIIVEIPCGFTAAAIVCLALNVQQYMIEHEQMKHTITHRLHAMVISIISLICWLHKATVLYEYLNKIIRRRAKYAPQLNPPLNSTYLNAKHHDVLWNKKDLFLDDWEARYGLWKCFRNRRF